MTNHIKHALAFGVIAAAGALPMQAQMQAPMIEFHTLLYEQNGPDHSFGIGIGATENMYIDIDFGYGPMEYKVGMADIDPTTGNIKGTVINGQVSPEGVVKIYGDPTKIDFLDLEGIYIDEVDLSQLVNVEVLNMGYNELNGLDISHMSKLYAFYGNGNGYYKTPLYIGPNHPDLTILDISVTGSIDQSLNLSDYPNLMSFQAWGCKDLRTCNTTNCTKLIQLSIDGSNVEKVDVSNNPDLLILNVGETRVSELDLSNNNKIQQLYCGHSGSYNTEYKIKSLDISNLADLWYFHCAENDLTEIDLSGNPLLSHLGLQGNRLTSLDLSGNPDLYSVQLQNNYFDFVTLPANRFGEYYYYQHPFEFDRSYPAGATIDLSARLNRPNSTTTAVLVSDDGELGSDYYSYDNGVISLSKATPDSVYLEFRNTDLPDYALQTTKFVVKEVADFGKDNVAITWQLRPSTQSINLSVGIAGATPENPKRFSVDLGDGNIVDYTTTSNALPEMPMVVADKKNAGRMTLYIPEAEDLTAFSLTETPLSAINVTAAHSLSDLDLHGDQIGTIDLRYNRCLANINLNDNALENLDLLADKTANSKRLLKNVYANNNKLTQFTGNESQSLVVVELANNNLSGIDLGHCDRMERLDISGNNLTGISLQDCEALVELNLAGNNLAELYIPTYTPLETLDISGNKFPLSELPVCGTVANYTYAPQQAWALPEKAPGIKLTSQEVTIDGNSTLFKWYDAANNQELSSTEVEANGSSFKFLAPAVGKTVYATFENAAFPDLSGENIYRTGTMTAADAPTHVVATFTTTEATEGNITVTSTVPNNFIYIDWAGDGNLEQYELRDDIFSIFDINTYANSDVKIYTYDDQDGIGVLSLDNIKISKADMSKLTDVYSFALYDSDIDCKNLILPTTELSYIGLTGCDASGIDLSSYTELTSLQLSNSNLTEFDASPFKKIVSFAISNNSLKKLTLDNPVLWNFVAAGCELESIDLSKVPAMQQLMLSQNNLSSIDVSMLDNLKVLIISGNKFTLTTLPRVLSTYSVYEYSNQALYPVTLEDGGKIDLSSQLLVGTNRTTYRWFRDRNVGYLEDGSIAGDELVEGTEYTAEDGVFTFHTIVKDAVCVMTNAAFPDLVFITDPIDITVTGVDGISADSLFSVATANGTIGVLGANGMVYLYTVDGALAGTAMPNDGAARFDNVASGLYVVTDGVNTAKVLVK